MTEQQQPELAQRKVLAPPTPIERVQRTLIGVGLLIAGTVALVGAALVGSTSYSSSGGLFSSGGELCGNLLSNLGGDKSSCNPPGTLIAVALVLLAGGLIAIIAGGSQILTNTPTPTYIAVEPDAAGDAQ